MPLIILAIMIAIPADEMGDLGSLSILFPMFEGQENAGIKMTLWFGVNLMMKPMFLLVPMIVTMVVAADSFAGEKERKTIESLLILPITDKELILGKVFSAFIPGIIATWVSFGAFQIIVLLLTFDVMGFFIIGLDWYLLIFMFTPLFAIFSIILMIINSSRAKDSKSAQNISVIIIFPIISLFFTQMTNIFILNDINILILSGLLGLLDAFMIYLGGKQLNRDRLISRVS
jgi:ABC-2 type transport system permease protein